MTEPRISEAPASTFESEVQSTQEEGEWKVLSPGGSKAVTPSSQGQHPGAPTECPVPTPGRGASRDTQCAVAAASSWSLAVH